MKKNNLQTGENLVLATADKRKRYRFISEPLTHLGHSNIIIDANGRFSSYKNIIKAIILHRNANSITVFGGGIKNLLALILSKIFNIFFITRLGGDPFSAPKSKIKSAWKRRQYYNLLNLAIRYLTTGLVVKNSNGIIFVNEDTRKLIENRLKKSQNTWIISQYGPTADYSYPPEETPYFNILIVTNLDYKEKATGVCWLIDTLANWNKQRLVELIKVTVIGGGENFEYMKDCINLSQKKFQRKLDIDIAGYKQNLQPFYKKADLLLYNSTLDATPNVMLEAMSMGLPIMTNRFQPFKHIINDNETGLFYDDAKELTYKLEKMINNPKLLIKISEKSFEYYIENFSFSSIAKKVDEIMIEIKNYAVKS